MNDYHWEPIEGVPNKWGEFINPDLQVLAQSWQKRLQQLRESQKLKEFNERLSRQWAIETGIIERVYTLDRGITQMLIEKGIEASLIPHGASSKPAGLVVSIIKDQREVIDGLFDFVAHRSELSTFYIRQMHQVFMRHQRTTEALDRDGNYVEVEVIRGDWKKWPNNPKRFDGTVHEYCPPEQVASEMDRLIALHQEHTRQDIPPEIEAAWLHHRFTQIHPFQDGNGRIARALASLVFLRAGWFPLVMIDDVRDEYITASELADQGDLQPMVALFSNRQIMAFRQALSLSEDVGIPERSIQYIIQQSLERLRQRRGYPHKVFAVSQNLEDYTRQRLVEVASELNHAMYNIDHSYRANVLVSDEETDYWFKGQIIQIAKSFEYYANFRDHRAWVQLKIKEVRMANMLFSFHGLGYEFSGIMAATAFIEFRSESEKEESSLEGPYQICENIFQFSHQDDQGKVMERYRVWLERTILIGLEQWRKQI